MTIPRLLSDRYELGDILGFGGMSEVHFARDVRLHREVAAALNHLNRLENAGGS